jgi:hypothetical protein
MRLTTEELTEVLNTAIARQGEVELQAAPPATLEEAVEIARQLNIPEEHVLAAAEEVRRRGMRGRRRAALRRRRAAGLQLAAAGAGLFTLAGLGLLALSVPPLVAFGPLLVAAVWLFAAFRARFAPISDAEADRVELPPVPGECRVCGRPACSANATFCAEHRYRGPGTDASP